MSRAEKQIYQANLDWVVPLERSPEKQPGLALRFDA